MKKVDEEQVSLFSMIKKIKKMVIYYLQDYYHLIY